MIFIYAPPNRIQASLDSRRIVYLLLLFHPSAGERLCVAAVSFEFCPVAKTMLRDP